ncbi:hypothetical protein QYS48_24285 [Marivirga arenosa]|uniref:Uncharacterized protein n=1 Tax=Marivirga arenosa TaxID=3059076 RepID=A0AA49GDW8_9BACT|nr:hypothetical protein [Marivirga sp. ABR2-2]WKK85095.2 hypothetical protein QYS48_24285 [Marivirga sp. ABR2-2]
MKFYLTLILLLISTNLLGQKYGSALGGRIGEGQYGISLKQKVYNKISAEAITEFKANSYQFSILPKYHIPVLGKGLNLFIGLGIHYGNEKELGPYYGYDLIGGLELKLPTLPITISTDVKPSYHINHTDWFDFSAAVSIHYVLSKETKQKRQKARKKRNRRKLRQERREERRENRNQWLNGFSDSKN